MWLIRQLPHPWNLRVEEKGEIVGLDVFEHGSGAYPDQDELPAMETLSLKKPQPAKFYQD